MLYWIVRKIWLVGKSYSLMIADYLIRLLKKPIKKVIVFMVKTKLNTIKLIRKYIKYALWVKRVVVSDIKSMINEHRLILNMNDLKLARLRNIHKGKRCFIIGNAPSLAKTDLSLIEDEITFGVNKIFKSGFTPTYFTISDPLVAQQNVENIINFKDTQKLFPEEVRNSMGKCKNVIYFRTNTAPLKEPNFSPDAVKYVYHGETVNYLCLQLAYFMGIREVYLIGIDWDWGEKYNNLPFGTVIKGGKDTHFAQDYRSKDEKWVVPNIEIGELVFKKAREYYESHGGEIYNATRGGKLEIFPRVNYADIGIPHKENTLEFQRRFWNKHMSKHYKKNKEIFGYEYGDPNSIEAKELGDKVLGNYAKIKDMYLLPFIKDKVVVEIGSGGGKWMEFMLSTKKIICVDVNTKLFDYIKKHISSSKISFYLTKGDELAGIPDKSVDFIFSMDTFVRIPRNCIFNYFREFARVLKPFGNICVHLPCNDVVGSFERHFVDISIEEIKKLCVDNGFKDYEIDQNTIRHGVILKVGYHGK